MKLPYQQLLFLALSQETLAATSRYLHQSCINKDCSALRVTVSNPPVNLWDVNLIYQFNDFLTSLNDAANDTKVVVISSDVSGYFVSQIDLNILAPNSLPPSVNTTDVLNKYYANLDLLLSTPVIFIGEVDGRAWGAGDEHLMRMDMRFAGPHALLGAPEAAVGLIHVGGLQQLTRLIGPGRASEYMLSAAEVSATEAARVGWVNSAYPTAQALRAHVDKLASRIALFHIEVLRATKESIARQAPSRKLLDADLQSFNHLASLPFLEKNVKRILEGSKNQSEFFERDNNDNVARLLYGDPSM